MLKLILDHYYHYLQPDLHHLHLLKLDNFVLGQLNLLELLKVLLDKLQVLNLVMQI
jgi:hypothetical protein